MAGSRVSSAVGLQEQEDGSTARWDVRDAPNAKSVALILKSTILLIVSMKGSIRKNPGPFIFLNLPNLNGTVLSHSLTIWNIGDIIRPIEIGNV